MDHVVVAVGSEANTDLAESSGLEVHSELGGFLVNSEMAARTDLYAVSTILFVFNLGNLDIEKHFLITS